MAVLTKEAALAAMGVGAYELHDYVDFSSWFASTLLPVRFPRYAANFH